MKREETVDYNIKGTWLSISRMYNQYGLEFDITASTGFVLLNIDADEGTPATKIAPLMGLEARSLTRMLKTMEEKKWIYREPDPEDGRSVRIFLTDLGKEKREFSRVSVKEFNNRVRELVPDRDLQTFFKVIQIINNVAEDKNVIQNFLSKIELTTTE
ncbi:MAG: MarR family transcriptional regulator [Cyclobacteriaceae bacterium]|nr:MarR family transcriptional regulator [Cyclobacteriaceae bacterium HetDA_MAG_MS6]